MEIVQVVSQIATIPIGVFSAWVAYQMLLKTPTQEPEPKLGANVLPGQEKRKIKVFRTSKQTTWLEVTNNGLECHLDDLRPESRGGHQWTISKSDAALILKNHDFRIDPGYKLQSGLFSIGPRRNWLYSKKFFPEPKMLESEIQRLLEIAGDSSFGA